MDYTTIISAVITIAVLGATLYQTFKANVSQHKTTQGKVDAVIQTAQQQQSKIDQLVKDIEDLKNMMPKQP